MTMNLVVPSGKVKFVFFENNEFYDITLSQKNYLRLTIKPKIWFGFMGLDKKISIVANFSNIKHDPFEYKKLPLNKIIYNW